MTAIAAALAEARRIIPAAEARLLLCHVLGCSTAWIEAHRDDALGEAEGERFAGLASRRAAGEPVAYLVGTREFYGRDFAVSPAVLIPRPETELLIDLVKAGPVPSRVLDLGTGSGCLAITLALELPRTELTAIDRSPDALVVARGNAECLGARVRFLEGDWFDAVAGERFDVIVSNPPYVAEADPHLREGDLRFEPAMALRCGTDGLDAIRRIVAQAPSHLIAGGRLLFEHGYDQAEAAASLLAAAGFSDPEAHRDLAGIVRVSGGRHP